MGIHHLLVSNLTTAYLPDLSNKKHLFLPIVEMRKAMQKVENRIVRRSLSSASEVTILWRYTNLFIIIIIII